ncbi:pyridoxal phosphate-dependent transferase [Vibrio chagasii]|uniref:pyridoxal phosphate-dependent transferase n=1 Tax=Vibrio chagasii TaxID=170679 RepID=UPI0038CD3CE8
MMLNTEKKMIGGEQELANDGLFYGVTNSGRSSLRWAVRSMSLQGKRVLVPNFVCQIVVDVLLEFDIEVLFYAVQDNFEFEFSDDYQDISAVYLVKYFGHESTSYRNLIERSQVPLIIDDVFGVEPPKVLADVQWCYFNSLRKITAIADFSQLISNVPLERLNKFRLSEFSEIKYQAKNIKAEFLSNSIGNESDYLSPFSYAENLLDSGVGIYEPEDKSTVLACQFYSDKHVELKIRKENLTTAKELLRSDQYIDINVNFPSFLPLLLANRDRVRNGLMEHSIFLAVHWPEVEQVSNQLSGNVLSLPLDSRYTQEDISRICNLIKKLDK